VYLHHAVASTPSIAFTLSVRNYRGLKQVVWRPTGVCVLVGPNGSGKTTLLKVLDLLREAISSGLARALENHGGPANVRHHGAGDGEEVEISLAVAGREWTLRPAHVLGAGFRSWERFVQGDQTIFNREMGDDMMFVPKVGKKYPARDTLALNCAINNESVDQQAIAPILRLVQDFKTYGHYDLQGLRREGSPMSSDRRMDRTGRNVFSVLRGWRDRRSDRHRIDFVLSNLADAFPDIDADLEFSNVAQIVVAEVRLRAFDKLIQLPLVPDGWLVTLLHLSAVASTDPGGAISIDEPENSLHPFAIRHLVEAFREWSERYGVTVLLATHSPVLLDTFKKEPDHVFVIEPSAASVPMALDELKTRNWLAHFALGDLYAHGEYGAPPESGLPSGDDAA